MKELKFKVAKAVAKTFLRWSDYWADVAEAINTGDSVVDVRERHAKSREG